MPPAATPRRRCPVRVEIDVREGARTLVGTIQLRGNRSVPRPRCGRSSALKTGAALQRRAARVRLRRAAAAVRESRLSERQRRRQPRLQRRSDARRSGVHRSRGAAPVRRSRADRRQRAHEHVDDRARTAVQDGRSAGPGRREREPAAARVARAVPARADPRAAARRRKHARRAGLRRGSAGDDDRLRRRRRGARLRSVPVAANGGAAEQRLEFAPRASFQIGRRNLFGKNRSANLFTSVSLYPSDSRLFEGQSVSTSSSTFGFTEYRVLGTFREPRLFNTPVDALLTGTLEQQIRSSFNFARRGAGAAAGATPDARRQRDRHLSDSADPGLRPEHRSGRSAADRPHVSAGPAVVVLGLAHRRHARRCGGAGRGALPERERPARGARHRIAGRLREGVLHRAGVPHAAAHQSHRARRQRTARHRDGISARSRHDRSDWPGRRQRRARPAGERAIFRRRRHDDSRIRARLGRPAGDDQRARASRTAATASSSSTPSCARPSGAPSAPSASSTPATSSRARPRSTWASSAAPSASAFGSSRRSDRSASTSASRSHREVIGGMLEGADGAAHQLRTGVLRTCNAECEMQNAQMRCAIQVVRSVCILHFAFCICTVQRRLSVRRKPSIACSPSRRAS